VEKMMNIPLFADSSESRPRLVVVVVVRWIELINPSRSINMAQQHSGQKVKSTRFLVASRRCVVVVSLPSCYAVLLAITTTLLYWSD
jgi:hypothetical protein